MKQLYSLVACLLQCTCLAAFQDWEQVYPEPVLGENGEYLFQIGGRRHEYENHALGEGQFFEQYLMAAYGSTYLLTIHPEFTQTRWDYYWSIKTTMAQIETGIPFPISAIASFQGEWIIGGANGEIALHHQSYPSSSTTVSKWENTDYGEDNWILTSIGSSARVEAITVLDDRLLALCDGSLFGSTNGGQDWQRVVVPGGITDIESHGGALYALQITDAVCQLFQSTDGFIWQSVWSVLHGADATLSSDLVVYDENLNGYYRSMGKDTRLYVFLDTIDELIGVSTSLVVSTHDGQNWHDHGSHHADRDPDTGFVRFDPWNPLELPISSRNLSAPDHDYLAGTMNMRVTEEGVQSYNGTYWNTKGFFSDTLGFITESFTQWGNMRFVANRGNAPWLMTFKPDGTVSRDLLDYNLPDKAFHYQQVVVNGKYYGTPYDDSYWIVETDDFEGMFMFLPPENGNVRKLMANDGKLVIHYEIWQQPNPHGALVIWDGSWSEPIPLSYGVEDVTYCESTGLWYTLEHVSFQDRLDPWAEEYHVNSVDREGGKDLVAVLYPQWGESYRNLDSPDQERILVYGYDEMAVVNPDGAVYYPVLGDMALGAYNRINGIQYINGWYYLMLSPNFPRTRDFVNFEPVQTPDGGYISKVAGYNGNLYAFGQHAVFRRPLERGYLGSIQHPRGWYHADWLGWFRIINQELGDIEHLILGSCWVKQTSGHEFWIRSAGLGWIYMNSDWSPWAYRLDDGHWYWLDLNGWPPRAWDDNVSVWRALQP